MKRPFVAMLAAVSMLALIIPASVMAGAGYATCDYNSTNHKVTVAFTGEVSAHLTRDTSGHIALNDVWCGGAATVTNTDSILVTGDDMGQQLIVHVANGGFRPGRTNEAGTSDEIEFTVNFAGNPFGKLDTFTVEGTDAVQKIRLGRSSTTRRINLNAGEGSGVDADVFMTGVDRVIVFGRGGDDIVRATGKAGTGPNPIDLFLLLSGGDGNDVLAGGSGGDDLYGDAGLDKAYGNGNVDRIHLDDGASGDVGSGGDGADTCFVDPGDTCTP